MINHHQASVGFWKVVLSKDMVVWIASYLPSLRDFIRLWTTSKAFQQVYPVHLNNFWKTLLQYFLQSRKLKLDEASRSLFLLPPPDTNKFSSGLPSSSNQQQRQQQQQQQQAFQQLELLFTFRKCSRSGCQHKWFCEWDNHPTACWFHPGKLRNGHYLTCCRAGSFQEPGCKQGYHDGVFHMLVFSRREHADTLPSVAPPSRRAVPRRANGVEAAAETFVLPKLR
jgi:hypothetical protein